MNLRLTRYLVLIGLLVAFVTMAKPLSRAKHHTAKKELVNITVTGVTNQTVLKNINSAIKNIKSVHLTKPINDDSIYSIYQDIPKGIKEAMQPFGFFNPTIKKNYKDAHGIWYMNFHINEGPRSRVSDVAIKVIGQGASNHNFLNAIKHYPLKKHDYFELEKYTDGNNLLFEHAANLGYFQAKMAVNKIIVNLLNHTVKINIVFNTGIRHRFGQTHFSKTPFNPIFLHRYMAYQKGQYYSNNKVQKTQNNFASSSYFSQIIVAPEARKSKNGVTPMNVILKMRKRKAYTFGLGYSTDTQIRGTIGFTDRWVNSWGHYFDAKAQGSFVNNSIVAAYNIPWPNPVKDLFSLKVGAGKLDIKRGKSTSLKASVVYKHTYTKWEHTISFSYLNEQYDMDNLPKTRARLFYPDANISYYSTKNHINPPTGLRFSAELSGTPNALSTTSGFWQVKVESKAVATFLKNEQVAARLAFGRTSIKSINNLPLSLQFLIGGSQTVRGYSYQSIGPGKNMVYGSLEFRQRIWRELYLAGFYDFGNVSDTGLMGGMNTSAGPSIVYRSPIGIIELSVAWRLSTDKIKPRFVFSMGPEL